MGMYHYNPSTTHEELTEDATLPIPSTSATWCCAAGSPPTGCWILKFPICNRLT